VHWQLGCHELAERTGSSWNANVESQTYAKEDGSESYRKEGSGKHRAVSSYRGRCAGCVAQCIQHRDDSDGSKEARGKKKKRKNDLSVSFAFLLSWAKGARSRVSSYYALHAHFAKKNFLSEHWLAEKKNTKTDNDDS
jgi:hypothetical protein